MEGLQGARLSLHKIHSEESRKGLSDDEGRFSFVDLNPGNYSLSISHPDFVPEYRQLDVAEGQDDVDLRVSLTPAAFIEGRIVDEFGEPPHRGYLTLFWKGEKFGRSGFHNYMGDHRIAVDGQFR